MDPDGATLTKRRLLFDIMAGTTMMTEVASFGLWLLDILSWHRGPVFKPVVESDGRVRPQRHADESDRLAQASPGGRLQEVRPHLSDAGGTFNSRNTEDRLPSASVHQQDLHEYNERLEGESSGQACSTSGDRHRTVRAPASRAIRSTRIIRLNSPRRTKTFNQISRISS
jgi:hypothetical protein